MKKTITLECQIHKLDHSCIKQLSIGFNYVPCIFPNAGTVLNTVQRKSSLHRIPLEKHQICVWQEREGIEYVSRNLNIAFISSAVIFRKQTYSEDDLVQLF